MKLSAKALGLSGAIVASLFWIICSLLVVLSPGSMMKMTGQMVHLDVTDMSWSLDWPGFFMGLITWSLLSGLCGWLIAFFYNRLTPN